MSTSINEKVLAISKALKESAVFEEGKVSFKDNSDTQAYIDNLPENITIDHVKTVHNYDAQYAAGSTLAIGQIAAEEFEKDDDLEEVMGYVHAEGRNKLRIKTYREKSFPNIQKPGERISKPYTEVKVEYQVGHNVADMKLVKDLISELVESTKKAAE